MKSALQVIEFLRNAHPFRFCMTYTTENHLLLALHLLHQCIFILKSPKQYSKQIYRKEKANKNAENKRKKKKHLK
jgi:hypothetical protein